MLIIIKNISHAKSQLLSTLLSQYNVCRLLALFSHPHESESFYLSMSPCFFLNTEYKMHERHENKEVVSTRYATLRQKKEMLIIWV